MSFALPGFRSFSAVGFSEDTGGFSVAYSWWHNSTVWNRWNWICHESDRGFGQTVGTAVVNDYGDLVSVS